MQKLTLLISIIRPPPLPGFPYGPSPVMRLWLWLFRIS